METKSKIIVPFSYLRVTAIVGIILLHVSSTLLDNPDLFSLTQHEEFFFRAAIAVLTWCAPCFLMISGALLLKKEKIITIKDCVFKYARRMFLSLLLFGIPFAMLMEFSTIKRISISLIPSAVLRILTNQSFAHLWYLYMIIGIYLLLPIIKIIINNCNKATLQYLIILLFLFNFVIPILSKITGLMIAFTIPVSSCYPLYLLLGYYLYHYEPNWGKNNILSLLMLIISLTLLIWGTVTSKTGMHDFATYDNPLSVVATICVFNLFRQTNFPVSEKIWKLDRLSFGVYLIHPVFIHFLFRITHITPTLNFFIIKTIVLTCVVTIVSYICIWIMSLVPPIKKYIL